MSLGGEKKKTFSFFLASLMCQQFEELKIAFATQEWEKMFVLLLTRMQYYSRTTLQGWSFGCKLISIAIAIRF